jgi:hypothetical protein
MPLITVLMPAKNAASTIGTAVRSTHRALPRDAEIVVWNDASSDSTAEVADALGLPRVRLFNTAVAVGSGAARAALMDATDSKFVACMDADDVCLPWRFRDSLLPDQRVPIRFSPLIRFSKDPRRSRITRVQELVGPEVALALLVHNPLTQPTMIAERSAVERIGGYSSALLGQDYELWLRAAANNIVMRRAGPPVVAYRVSPSQVTNRTDYRERFIGDPLLQDSYRDLLRRIDPCAAISETGPLTQQDSFVIREAVTSRLDQFGRSNRRYYSRLARRPGIGLTRVAGV